MSFYLKKKSFLRVYSVPDGMGEGTPRDAALFQRSCTGHSFLIEETDSDDFFCLANEKKPLKPRAVIMDPALMLSEGRYESNSWPIDSRDSRFSKIKQERICCSTERHSTGSFQSIASKGSQSASCFRIDSSCPDRFDRISGSARIKLKCLKPLPPKSSDQHNQVAESARAPRTESTKSTTAMENETECRSSPI